MKALLGFAAVLIGVGTAAQTSPKFQTRTQLGKSLDLTIKDSLPQKLIRPFQLWQQNGGTTILSLRNQKDYQGQPLYLGETRLGPVYTLPQDNMPCIMPSIANSNMPNPSDKSVLRKPIDPGIYMNRKTVIK